MKRTALVRRTPLKRSRIPSCSTMKLTRRKPSRRGASKTTYAQRPRHVRYMLWVKTLPCALAAHGGCDGPVEADHDSRGRGMSQKSHDSTCVPLCTAHHVQRTTFSGYFSEHTQATMRVWFETALQYTHACARAAGVTIPEHSHEGEASGSACACVDEESST